MAVTIEELAVALRISADPDAAVDPAVASVLSRLHGASTALVETYASVGTPDLVKDQAVVLMASYLWDQPASSRNRAFATAWINSGASSICEPWRIRRAGLLSGESPAVPVVPEGSGLDRAAVLALISDWAETGNLEPIPADKLSNAPGGIDLVARAAAALAQETADTKATLAAALALIVSWAQEGNAEPIPADKLTLAPTGERGEGISIAAIKAFARTGNTTPPTPADLAADPMAGRVLGLRTAGGQLQTSWNQLSAGSPHFVLDAIPTPAQQAIGGLLPQGGVVLVRETQNDPSQLWVRISPAFALVLFHTFGDPIVKPLATGMLPAAADYLNRLGLAGNYFYRALDLGGHDKVVEFRDYGPTRPEPPTRSAQELLYGGSVANPPHSTIGNFVVNTIMWDRGSEVWIIKATADAVRWSTYSGPIGYHTGRLYQSESDAAVHVANASEVGDIYIIGHGANQRPKIVTAYTAPTANDPQWIPIGLTIQDVADQVQAHNVSGSAHQDIRALTVAAVAAHDISETAHPDIRALVASLQAASGVTILPYAAGSTYSRGSSNSIVTHADGLFIYISSVERNSDHDPGQHPGYWFQLSEGVGYEVVVSGAHRFSARTIVVDGNTDAVYLCTTTQTTPRDLAHIAAQASSVGGTFIQLVFETIPRGKLPPVREWILNATYKKGEIVDTSGTAHLHYIALADNNSSSIANRKQPGTPDGVGVWDRFYTVDNPPPAPPASGFSPGDAVEYH